MMERYKILFEGGEGELTEKNPASLPPQDRWKRGGGGGLH